MTARWYVYDQDGNITPGTMTSHDDSGGIGGQVEVIAGPVDPESMDRLRRGYAALTGSGTLTVSPAEPPPFDPCLEAITWIEAGQHDARPARPRAPLSEMWIGWMIAVYAVLSVATPVAVSWWFGVAMVCALLRTMLARPE
jgi:hypothetical protein